MGVFDSITKQMGKITLNTLLIFGRYFSEDNAVIGQRNDFVRWPESKNIN